MSIVLLLSGNIGIFCSNFLSNNDNGEGAQLINLLHPTNGYNSKFANELRQKLGNALAKNSVYIEDDISPCIACSSKEIERMDCVLKFSDNGITISSLT